MERAELPVPLGADPLQSLTSPALWLQVQQKVRIAWSRLQLRTYGRTSILGGSELVGTTNCWNTHCVVFRHLKSADCYLRSAALWLQT